MKNDKYWAQRILNLEKRKERHAGALIIEYEKAYRTAEKEIAQKINNWYQRFADNNEITLSEAKKRLTVNELEEFKMDVWEYIEKGKTLDYSDKWAKQLEDASARVHVQRLEALQLDLQQTAEELYGNRVDGLEKQLTHIYNETYYRTAYEVQKGLSVGFEIAKVNTRQLELLFSKPWDRYGTGNLTTFSNDIWFDLDRLKARLSKELTQNVMLGKAPRESIDRIAKAMNTSKSNAGRLVMTESSYIYSHAQEGCYKELDVEQYRIVATLDNKTSEICRELDGKVFKQSDYAVGITAPPFHPWCRTVTVPHFDDGYGKRIARGKDGKTYYIDGNITYRQWEKMQGVA